MDCFCAVVQRRRFAWESADTPRLRRVKTRRDAHGTNPDSSFPDAQPQPRETHPMKYGENLFGRRDPRLRENAPTTPPAANHPSASPALVPTSPRTPAAPAVPPSVEPVVEGKGEDGAGS